MEPKLSSALRICDKCKTYAELCRTFDEKASPILEQALQSPTVKAPRDHTTPDECSPRVAELREALCTRLGAHEATPAEDDVWFLIYRAVSNLVERQQRKRSRDRDGVSLSTLVTNCFVLLCTRTLPQLDHVKLRWGFLKKERAALEASDAYVHSNASERRKLQLNATSVLSVFSEKAHKHYFTLVWMVCVEKAGEAALHIHLLHRLGSVVLPHLTNPLVLADYLTGCFSSGGIVSILSLQGLFLLMLDHGLEYPNYYEQLYSLLTPDAFASRHRYELFRLLDLSMTSLRVPSYIAASVIKRVAQVSLMAPAPTLYFTLPFLRKVLQTHPNCIALIHRSSREAVVPEDMAGQDADTATAQSAKAQAMSDTAALFDGRDPFDDRAKLPETHALNSTLWELTALERHFMPVVPLMVSAFSSTAEDKTPLRYEKSYGRLFTAEVTRAIDSHHLPTIAYEAPSEADPTDLLSF
ncbi:CBF/Mak21 family, putative [Leishmania lindenbergi]|uniref:CBF/Mak21 family n=1 Tax=Leishmania lindenbergi TaxID=651832 RepID=A0AAW3AI90_9TRYP